MELIGRLLDGSISYNSRGIPEGPSYFGGRVSQDDKITRLEEVSLFDGCTRRQLKRVAKIAEVIEVPAGSMLARKGDTGNEFFVILDGTARVELSAKRQVRLGPGEHFGEMSLLDGGPRSATVIADTPLRLLVIKRRDFSSLLRDVPDVTQNILVTLSKRLRGVDEALGGR
jgi:CRP-like cAMP-binding protein